MFIKTEVANPAGGSYVDMGTVQLLSVPYALYAKNVENKDDADADSTNEIQDLNLDGNTLTITNKVNPTAIDLAPFAGVNTDNQTLSLIDTDLSISGGNTIDLSPIQDGVNDADADSENELQSLTLTGDTLKISNGNQVVFNYDSSNWAINGNKLYYNTGNVGIGTNDPNSKLEVKSSATGALFQVINANNDTVFAVYPDGVKVFVDASAKGSLGGFAVSGRTSTKAGENIEYFRVTPDSTRIYVNEDTTSKGSLGGFAVSGRTSTKGSITSYLEINRDSTRIYVTEESGKGSLGGFAVSGRTSTKSGLANDYFNISGNQNTETIDSSQARIMWYPRKEAFLTGRVLIESPDNIGTNSMSTGFESKAMGDYSQAMGYKSIASGAYSTAIGYQALANDSNSFAFGNYAQALGKNSFAFGDSAIVESEDGYAIGAYAYTSGRGSFAIGSKDRYYTDSYELRTTATGELSMAMGLDADATGEQSVAIGNSSKASGAYSVALGRSADASADYSLALSYGIVTSSGTQSIAMGGGTASNSFSFAQGLGSVASGYISTAFGPYNEATNSYSLAMGYKGKATGSYATAIGNNVTAQSYSSFVCGYYNIVEGNSATPTATDPLFVIGNGTYITPSNALTVLHNGNMKLKGNFYPVTNNTYNIGTSTYRWNTIYATNGTINTSDKRLKTNIVDINYGLKEILELRPVTFSWKDEPEKGIKLGLIAQEVQNILKEVVSVGDDENQTLGIAYSDIIPVLIKAIQEQHIEIESLKSENLQLKIKLEEFNKRLETLEK